MTEADRTISTPNGIQTRASGVKGQRPCSLDDGGERLRVGRAASVVVVRQVGIEPTAVGLRVRCSTRLSYWRKGARGPGEAPQRPWRRCCSVASCSVKVAVAARQAINASIPMTPPHMTESLWALPTITAKI